MMNPLSTTANVFGGIRPKAVTDESKAGDQPLARLLQPKNLADGEDIDWDQLPLVEIPQKKNHLLREGDVLVLLRGAMLRAILVQSNPPAPAVASNHIAVVRTDAEGMLPAFLVAALNHPTTRSRAQAHTSGTTVQFLSIKSLGKIEIPCPSIEKQKQIAHLDRLRQKLHKLTEEKIRMTDRLVDALIQQKAMKGTSR